jgi:ubiquinone/menaquinone biosynthesis C-methylase UbiE
LAVHGAIGDDGTQASTPEPGHHLHHRMRSYDFPDSSASVTVSDLPDGRRRVSVDAGPAAPATPLFIAQHECETNYPLELIELVLDVKGPGWVCDEISREERPEYIKRTLYWTICSHIDESEAAGRRILDYGCGSGASTMVLARMFPRSEIVGIDIDARSLDIARARLAFYGYENVTFRLASSASSTPEELGRFHFVTFSALYEHLLPDERRSILPAVWRSLEPGGVLFVAETPHRYWPIEAHTTGLPLINYLPDTLTLRVVHLAARRGETGRTWSELLRAGIRGGTEEQFVAQLAPPGAARPEVLRPTRLGLRDEFDLWYAISGSTGRRRVKRALASMLRALKRLTGISLVPYIAFAVRKSTNPVNATPATSPGPLAA